MEFTDLIALSYTCHGGDAQALVIRQDKHQARSVGIDAGMMSLMQQMMALQHHNLTLTYQPSGHHWAFDISYQLERHDWLF